MKCVELEALWIPYLDGKLPVREREIADGHLAGCAECAARIRDFGLVSGLLEQWEAPAPSPWFNARLRQRIAAQPAPGWFDWLPVFSPGFPLGVAALLLLAALLISTGGQRAPLPPPQVVTVEKTDEVIHAVEEVNMLTDFDLLSELKRPAGHEAGEKGRQ